MSNQSTSFPAVKKYLFTVFPLLPCLLLLIGVHILYAQNIDPSFERAITKAVLKIENNDFEGAAADAQEALRINPHDERAALYLGIALSRSGKKEAEEALKKALSINPQNPRTNLELGIYYYNQGISEGSKDYLETTLRIAPNTEIASKAQQYLNSIKTRNSVKPWALNLSLGGQYDSNVVLNDGDALPEGISDKADWRAVFTLRAKYNFLRSEKIEGSLGYSFYQSLHASLSDFNVTDNLPELTMAFHLAPWITLKGMYAFDHALVGGDAFSYSHIITPSVVFSYWKGLATTVDYKYKKNHYMDTDLFDDNSARTGFNNFVGITETVPVSSYGSIRFGYSYDNEAAEEEYWSYSGNRYFLGMQWNLPVRFYLDLYGEYYNKNYKERYPSADRLREDIMKTISGSLTKVFSDRFSASISQLYIRNKSSDEIFDYDRAITSLFFTVRF
jgi:tetratricopeptide (TPR) repeat protein